MLGVRRARSFVIAITSSAGRSSASTRASFAGVVPAESRTTSARLTPGSTSMRANATSSIAIASGGDREVEAVPRDVLVDRVEVVLGDAVELDDPPVVHDEAGLRIERRPQGDEPELDVLDREAVQVHPLGIHEADASYDRIAGARHFAHPRDQRQGARWTGTEPPAGSAGSASAAASSQSARDLASTIAR